MVKKIFLSILMLSICSTAYAARWVIIDPITKQVKRTRTGGGVTIGCATDGYAIIHPHCMKANEQEYTEAKLSNKKVDFSIITGNRVVDMTQAEIDAKAATKQSKIDSIKAARLIAQDNAVANTDTTVTLTKVDTAIDNIQNLNDAKVFLKKLVRYIIANNGSD